MGSVSSWGRFQARFPTDRVAHEPHECYWIFLHRYKTASTFQHLVSLRLLLEETILQTVNSFHLAEYTKRY